MRPKNELFRVQKTGLFTNLDQIIDSYHPLAQLAGAIHWERFDEQFGKLYTRKGRPGIPTRLMVALHYLKHTYNESDETVVRRMVENPYWQFFCGFNEFLHKAPIDRSSMSRWRKMVGKSGLEVLLQETLAVAYELKHLRKSQLDDVVVDTTVQEKNISFPTDAKLINKAREQVVKAAQKRGIDLRQSYVRVGKTELAQYSRYAHAKQFKRARRSLRRLKTYLGRVIRDVQRKCDSIDSEFSELLQRAVKIHNQKKSSKNKIYSWHEPKVDCISKGKAHKRYEFGCKVSLMTTSRSHWIVGCIAHHGGPYDGHTLPEVLEHTKRITGRLPSNVYADKGYRRKKADMPALGSVQLHIPGTKRGKTKRQIRLLRKRSSIEPIIGHMKHDHRMARNFLKGVEGDHFNALLAASGKNLSKLLALVALSPYFFQIFWYLSFTNA